MQLEATVQRLVQQLEEVSELRDKEALELATLKREVRLRGLGDSLASASASASASGSASGHSSGHSDSPQLPGELLYSYSGWDFPASQRGADNVGVYSSQCSALEERIVCLSFTLFHSSSSQSSVWLQ